MRPTPSATILIVDDDEGLRSLMKRVLRREGFAIAVASSGQEAIAWLGRNSPDVILLDLKLEDLEGRDLVHHQASVGRPFPFIVITGRGDELQAVEMMKLGAIDYLVKDSNVLELLPGVVRRAIDRLAGERRLAEAEAALRHSEERYRTLFESMDEGFCVIEMINDASGKAVDYRFLEINPAFVRQTGLAEALTKTMRTMVPNIDEYWFEIYGRVARTGEAIRFQNPTAALQRYFDIFAVRIGGAGSQRVGIVFNDITLRKQSEEALRRQAKLLELSQEAIFVWRMGGAIEFWNNGAAELYGYSVGEAVGHSPAELLQTRYPTPLSQIEATLRKRGAWAGELRQFTKNRQEVIVSSRLQLVPDAGGAPVVLESNRDITDRRRLEAELMEITDREQRRIGYDLHDGLGQELTGLEMKCFVLQEDLAADDLLTRREQIRGQLEEISHALRECVTTTRSLARGLAPVNMKADGLRDALEHLALRTDIPGMIECRFHCAAPVILGNSQVGNHLFRIAQEAVNNALKHAKTRRIDIHLERGNDLLRLQVKDAGRGLPKRGKAKSGMGMEVMRHRAQLMGASLEIDSRPGEGVTVLCTLPWTNS